LAGVGRASHVNAYMREQLATPGGLLRTTGVKAN
jgi:hypothetical protein